jgi:hypothetical protein
MKLRQIKRRTYRAMTNPSWDYLVGGPSENKNKMYHIRGVGKCKSYHAWCSDCNARLFPKLHGRFPYTMSEFNEFEADQQSFNQFDAKQQETRQ